MGHRYLRFGLFSMDDQLDPVCCGVGESVENEITHKNVQKKVKCDPCAISACETSLVCEVVLGHEREYFAFG